MESLIRNVRKCLFTALALLAPAMPVRADVTYLLNNYPAQQAGGTISGSITVVDTADDDGLLQAGEIVHWTFTLTQGANTATVDSATTPFATLQLYGTILITGRDILIPLQGGYNSLSFSQLLGSIHDARVEWRRVSARPPCQCSYCKYSAEDLQGTPPSQDDVTYWATDGENFALGGTDPWLIATNPNPPPPPGACCNPATGGCLVLSPADCAAFGGTFVGPGITCASAACTACPADFNGDGAVTVPDIFSFLAAWFAGCP